MIVRPTPTEGAINVLIGRAVSTREGQTVWIRLAANCDICVAVEKVSCIESNGLAASRLILRINARFRGNLLLAVTAITRPTS